MLNKLSVVVLTHNDESRIVDCLECLTFADEIIIIDDESVDRTIEISRQYTKNIFERSLNSNFANQRNYALNLVHNNWVLFIDSDELVSIKLRNEIISAIQQSGISGFLLKRIDVMWNRRIKHGESGDIHLLRLAKKDSGRWHGKVHEEWRTHGKVQALASPMLHIPHQTMREFVTDINEYSTLRADELYEHGALSSGFAIFLYPTVKFFKNYILKQGYKDGIAGFIYSMTMSFHSFLVRSKLYLKLHSS